MGAKKLEKKLFGTNGVRAVVGKDLTPQLVMKIGLALGTMRKGRIAVGMDSRTSGPALIAAVKAGLMAVGCDVVDCGMLPTPALQYIVKGNFDGGAMITASHNPPEYNGIKIIEPDGTEMGDEETIELESLIFLDSVSLAKWDEVGSESIEKERVREYVAGVLKHFPQGIGTGIKVVIDPGCGAAVSTTPEILSAMGTQIFTINSHADGHFPGRLPEPSEAGLKPLSTLVIATGASFGVAHDGDADRAVFIDEKGAFIEENKSFALIVRYLCNAQKGVIVTPVSTSNLIERVAKELGSTVVYTPVGSIYVARTMINLENEGQIVVMGGEGNGGLIYREHQLCRDGGMSAAVMVALLAKEKKPLSELISRLPPSFMLKEKITTNNGTAILEKLRDIYKNYPIDDTDGIRITVRNGWALIRLSGTEPLVRVMVEFETKEEASTLYNEIIGNIKALI